MATPIKAPMAGEIWHLSIEDLFQPVTEVQRLGGDGPFVINLSVSTAPINTPTKVFDVCRDAHIYQIQVTEDGRMRYRLRLGPFANEDQADAVLAEVRETYPGALTATAGPSDLRVIASMQPKVEPKPSEAQSLQAQARPRETAEAESEISIDMAWLVVPVDIPLLAVPGVTPTVPPKSESPPAAVLPVELAPEWALPELNLPQPKAVAAGPVAKAPTPRAAPRAAESVTSPIPIAVDAPVLTEAVVPKPKPATAASQAKPAAVAPKAAASASKTPPPAVAASRAAAPAAAAAAPMKPAAPKVAPGAPVPVKAASTAPQPNAATPGPRPAAKTSIFAHAIASALKSPAPKPRPYFKPPDSEPASLRQVVVATAPAPVPREVKKLDEPLESLEFTQTVRALTAKELEDIESSRWFVIQLALADRAFDPDAVPNLDIFSEYRLYSVAGLDQGRVVHALRLGFFREEIGAVAVASYLAEYWDKPTIKRVSVAERERFANQKVEARKDVGATGTHSIIEITDELVAPRKRTPQHVPSAKSPNQPSRH